MRSLGMSGMLSIASPTFKEVEDRIIIAINMKIIEKATIFLNGYIYHLDQARLELLFILALCRELHTDI
jgi:hypothetical protein